MPRLVRRAPLGERLRAFLDPEELLFWLSEHIHDDTYNDWLKDWATPIGAGLNILFVLARGASSCRGGGGGSDDVFGDVDDGNPGRGWIGWVAAFLVQGLTALCCLNALYTFARKRHYRLFEQSVHVAPATPSARRVLVNDSPVSSSPLRYLRAVMDATVSSATASKDSSPDPEQEVWELRVWDPTPFNLTTFTLFSPGHLFLYYSLLPPSPQDSHPSLTIITAFACGALLSLQLTMLKTSFSQQAKDATLVHGQVMNEYDTKYVRPALQHPVRDVGIQTRSTSTSTSPQETRSVREVDVHPPTTIVNRGFRTNPNPNYAAQYDPASQQHYSNTPVETPRQSLTLLRRQSSTFSQAASHTPTNQLNGMTPGPNTTMTDATTGTPQTDFSSPLKPHHERVRARTPHTVSSDGGSMGVYSHAASPMRKSSSGANGSALSGSGVNRTRDRDELRKRLSTPGRY